MVVMFVQISGVKEDIVYVNDHKPMKELSEHLIHEALKDGQRVGEAIWHDLIFLVT